MDYGFHKHTKNHNCFLTLKVRNVSLTLDQHIRLIYEGSCDTKIAQLLVLVSIRNLFKNPTPNFWTVVLRVFDASYWTSLIYYYFF